MTTVHLLRLVASDLSPSRLAASAGFSLPGGPLPRQFATSGKSPLLPIGTLSPVCRSKLLILHRSSIEERTPRCRRPTSRISSQSGDEWARGETICLKLSPRGTAVPHAPPDDALRVHFDPLGRWTSGRGALVPTGDAVGTAGSGQHAPKNWPAQFIGGNETVGSPRITIVCRSIAANCL